MTDTNGLSLCLSLLCLVVIDAMAAPAVRIIDGDTLEIAGIKYRLYGIDAPEQKQQCSSSGDGPPDKTTWPCGRTATAKLRALINGQPVRCVGSKKDRYRRIIAVCYRGVLDLNAEMVRTGYARAYRKYSKDYISHEAEARTHRRGIWRATSNRLLHHPK